MRKGREAAGRRGVDSGIVAPGRERRRPVRCRRAAPQTEGGIAGTKVSVAGSEVAVNKGGKLGLRERAHLLRMRLAALEQDQCRNAADSELARDARVGVDVELGHGEPPRVLLRHVLEDRRDHLAGAAPLGPVVHQHRCRGLQDFLFERGVRDVLDVFDHGFLMEGTAAASLAGAAGGSGPRRGAAKRRQGGGRHDYGNRRYLWAQAPIRLHRDRLRRIMGPDLLKSSFPAPDGPA